MTDLFPAASAAAMAHAESEYPKECVGVMLSGYMLPASAIFDIKYRPFGNAIVGSDDGIGAPIIPDTNHLFFGKLKSTPAPFHHVNHVAALRASNKVTWIATGWIVTGMPDDGSVIPGSIGNNPILKLVGSPMSEDGFVVMNEDSIPMTCSADPGPTGVELSNQHKAPEVFGRSHPSFGSALFPAVKQFDLFGSNTPSQTGKLLAAPRARKHHDFSHAETPYSPVPVRPVLGGNPRLAAKHQSFTSSVTGKPISGHDFTCLNAVKGHYHE